MIVPLPVGPVIIPPPVAGETMVIEPLDEPGKVIEPPVPPVTYIAETAFALVPSHLNNCREQVLSVPSTVPAPSTLVGQTKVRLPVESWQTLNHISWPVDALPADNVDDVTLPVKVMKNPCGLEEDTVNVGVAE